MATVVNNNLNAGKGSVKIKSSGDTKNVSASLNKPMSLYRNSPGPRDATGTKGS